jgi:hypothetical protein
LQVRILPGVLTETFSETGLRRSRNLRRLVKVDSLFKRLLRKLLQLRCCCSEMAPVSEFTPWSDPSFQQWYSFFPKMAMTAWVRGHMMVRRFCLTPLGLLVAAVCVFVTDDLVVTLAPEPYAATLMLAGLLSVVAWLGLCRGQRG